jgi:hypothetical protein
MEAKNSFLPANILRLPLLGRDPELVRRIERIGTMRANQCEADVRLPLSANAASICGLGGRDVEAFSRGRLVKSH